MIVTHSTTAADGTPVFPEHRASCRGSRPPRTEAKVHREQAVTAAR